MGVAVVFPGQGTQQPGMAAAWRGHPSWQVVERAEAALGEPLGQLVTDAPADALTRTREAQLAVLVTSLVAWDALEPLAEVPVAFAGHSLGQVTALIAPGAVSLEDGVRFAARRRAHPGRRRRPPRPDGRAARRDPPTQAEDAVPRRPTGAGSPTTTRRARS